MMSEVEEWDLRWRSLFASIGTDPADLDLPFRQLIALHSGASRYRYNLLHVLKVQRRIDALIHHASDPFVVRLAGFYRDAVRSRLMPVGRKKSALLAEALLCDIGALPRLKLAVRAAILGVPGNIDAQVVTEAARDELAADWEEYVGGAVALRKEYYFLPTVVYGVFRRARIKSLRSRPELFHLDASDDDRRGGPAEREARARDNLLREARALRLGSLMKQSRNGFDLTPLFR